MSIRESIPVLHLRIGCREDALHDVDRFCDRGLASPPEFVTALSIIANSKPVTVLVLWKVDEVDHVPVLGTIRGAASYDQSIFQISMLDTAGVFELDSFSNRLHQFRVDFFFCKTHFCVGLSSSLEHTSRSFGLGF